MGMFEGKFLVVVFSKLLVVVFGCQLCSNALLRVFNVYLSLSHLRRFCRNCLHSRVGMTGGG